jgi:uncharacterized protein YcbK (DUF882 family)
MNLSAHFTLEELTRSEYADRKGLDNKPDVKVIENLKRLAVVLEQVRSVCGAPIVVSSGYRSPKVNAGIGGQKTSQHLLGCAADIRAVGMTIDNVMKKIVNSQIQYDQLIKEFNSWIHISIPNDPDSVPRKQTLIIDRTGTRPYK